MAHFLAARGWAPPDPLTLQLREHLPDGYSIVAAARIYGCPIDALVVAPDGLHVLYSKEWLGKIQATAEGAWTVTTERGATTEICSPTHEAQRCQSALEAFLKDEFPGLHPTIHHLVVLMMPGAIPVIPPQVWPRLTILATVGEIIMGGQPPIPQLEEALREQLAIALCERQLTHSQRASESFIFRTGSRSAWTIGEAVQHIDRHPADGIYHLRNGTLIRWLRHEGAEHVASLAEAVMRQVTSDDRAMLETFLLGTGLVARPGLTMQPTHVEVGSIVSGDTASAVVRVQQKPGRGHLFGSFFAFEPWLRVEPDHFASAPVDVVISIDTGTLPIRATPYTATVEVLSSASDAPLPIAVHFKVVGMPSRLERYVLRPWLSLVMTGILGLCLGALVGLAVDATAVSPSASFFWMMAVGLLWALVGGIRGIYQPPSLPLKEALWYWSRRLAIWTTALFVGVVALGWAAQEVAIRLDFTVPQISPMTAGVAGAVVAVIPAAFGRRRTNSVPVEKRQGVQRSGRQRYVLAAGVVLLGLLLAAGLSSGTVGEAANQVTGRSGEWLTEVEARLDRWTDELILWIYDRRAPAQSQ